VPSCDPTQPGGDFWIQRGGHTAFLHLPNHYSPGEPSPLCLAFHGERQSCLDMVQTWRDVTDGLNAALVAVEWTGRPADASGCADQMVPIIGDLSSYYCVQPAYTVATGLGTGAVVALDAALFRCDWIHHAIAQNGATPQPFEPARLIEPSGRRVHLTVRTEDPAYDRTMQDVRAMRSSGVHVDLVEWAQGTAPPVQDLAAIWSQLTNPLDRARSCLSVVDLLRTTADHQGFAVAAVDWSGDPAQAVLEADSLTGYVETLETDYCVRATDLVAAGYGQGASVAIAGAITDRTACEKAAAFGGGFPAGWLSLPLGESGSKVVVTMGQDDLELPSTQTNLTALADLDADTRLITDPGPSTPQASDPEAALTWLR